MKILNKLFQSKKSYAILALVFLALVIVFILLIRGKNPVIENEQSNPPKEVAVVSKEVKFKDKELGNVIKKYLGKQRIYENDLKTVTRLAIRNTEKIKDFSELKRFENLQELTITRCSIDDIPMKADIKFENVEVLTVSNNQLTNLEILKRFPNLTRLNVSTNKITDISAIGLCKDLEYVNLLNNMVENEECIKALGKLHTIYVDDDFDRTQLKFMVGKFRNADVLTKKYLLEQQYDLD